MRGVLRSSLRRSLETLPALDRLMAAWPVACGAALARRGAVTGFEDGVVQVAVNDAAWMEQWLAMQAVLAADLGKIAGVKVGGIHFYKAASSR